MTTTSLTSTEYVSGLITSLRQARTSGRRYNPFGRTVCKGLYLEEQDGENNFNLVTANKTHSRNSESGHYELDPRDKWEKIIIAKCRDNVLTFTMDSTKFTTAKMARFLNLLNYSYRDSIRVYKIKTARIRTHLWDIYGDEFYGNKLSINLDTHEVSARNAQVQVVDADKSLELNRKIAAIRKSLKIRAKLGALPAGEVDRLRWNKYQRVETAAKLYQQLLDVDLDDITTFESICAPFERDYTPITDPIKAFEARLAFFKPGIRLLTNAMSYVTVSEFDPDEYL